MKKTTVEIFCDICGENVEKANRSTGYTGNACLSYRDARGAHGGGATVSNDYKDVCMLCMDEIRSTISKLTPRED